MGMTREGVKLLELEEMKKREHSPFEQYLEKKH
jgi:hypothetical protein